jgi:hypothetical protein
MSNQRHYEIVAEELQRRFVRPGLWTRAVAETSGEGSAARAFYIRLRVAEVIEIEQADRARKAEELTRRAVEEARVKKEQHEAEMRARNEQRDAEIRARLDEDRCRAQELADINRSRMGSERTSPFGFLFMGAFVIAASVLVLVIRNIFFR